jgi:putative PIN family toxin of toxin-antitoxin system
MGEKKKGLRVVLDTNVLVSALLFRGPLSSIVDLWESGRITPVLSQETFDEFQRVLAYPKFQLTKDEISALIEQCISYFDVVDVTFQVKGVCRDPYDDKFLSCALAASAGLLISGDRDLLDIGKYKDGKIISPVEFLSMFE